jgi:hydrogenase maturation protein HypF
MPEARRWLLSGRVQGVGFRPFVFRLAQRFGLNGRVQNLAGQVLIEAQGAAATLDDFAAALISEAPPLARPHLFSVESIPSLQQDSFEIAPSAVPDAAQVHIPPDYFLCDDCRREMLDPQDRRYRYPFINCTQCGPRYTLITRLPYDRPNTAMAEFALCPACRAEYDNPHDRRFHAEPLACPQCGPQLQFVQSTLPPPVRGTAEGSLQSSGVPTGVPLAGGAGEGVEVASNAAYPHPDLPPARGKETGSAPSLRGEAALQACIAALQRGEIVAVKGVGGYHLMCDATSAAAIGKLRERKQRPHKPLALMFPWCGADGLEQVRTQLQLDQQSSALLSEPMRAIVLLRRRHDSTLPEVIAPGLKEVGVMLPYSPLHHLLLDGLQRPLVATSANISGEPVLTDNTEVEARLGRVTQYFLHHNRPIVRPADDTVLRVIAGKPRLIRGGRGIAPLELALPFALQQPLLAVGGHTKNTIALGWGKRAVISPHIGDLDAARSMEVFEQVIADLQRLYRVTPQAIACDAHTAYASSRWSARQGLPLLRVWHHHAHASALAFEHHPDKTWLSFTWDGVGLGEDGSLWGGEALHGRPGAWQRVARLRSFRLPGGEKAGREPWRSAAALCWETGLDFAPPAADPALLKQAWQRGLNAPLTTAAGRLFDGAASLLGLVEHASYEGQGGMYLEQMASGEIEAVAMLLHQDAAGLLTADWQPLVQAMLNHDVPVALRAMQFHRSLARTIVEQAKRIHTRKFFDAVGLSGGVFQNRLLAELALAELAAAGFDAYLSERSPCNDGGIALGQLVEAGYK